MGKNKKQNNSSRSVEKTGFGNDPVRQEVKTSNKNSTKAGTKELSEKAIKIIKLGAYVLLFVFAIVLLGFYNYEFLYKTQNYSLFLGNDIFFQDTMENSSGLLLYISRYLTQILYYPWLGATILALGLVGMTKMIEQLRGGNTKLWGLDFIPALLLLLTQTSIGYTLYCNFENSYLVEFEIGFLIALGLGIGMKQVMSRQGLTGVLLCLLIGSGFYFIIGIFGLFATIIAGISLYSADKKSSIVCIVGGIILQCTIAYISSTYYINEEYSRALLSPLPDSAYTNLFNLSLLTLVTSGGILIIEGKNEIQIKAISLNLGLIVLGIVGVCYFTNRDDNFRTELKLQHLTENQDWNQVIETANGVEHPTNTIAAYRFLALNQTDRLWNEVFDYPARLDTIKSPYKEITDYGHVTDLYFYCYLPHKAYRWEMERWVTTGRNVETLKQFAIYALLRDEQPLAHKYIDLLKQTTFYKGWATEHEKYIGHQEQLLADNPSYKKIVDKEVKENIFTNNCNLQMAYAKYKHPTPEQREFKLMLDLYYQNMDQFVADFGVARDKYTQQMPKYLQEAVTIYAMKINAPDLLRMFPIDPSIVQQTQNFFKEFSQWRDNKAEGAKAMANYKGTFVYHMIFSNLFDYKQRNK